MAIANGIPLYNTTLNQDAADSISTDECLPGGSSGLGLTGTGVTLGVWDAAGVRLTHQEFGGRASQADGQSITHWHSTHVAGTMAAAGVTAPAKGMSPSASLDCYDWTYDTIEMRSAAGNGLPVSNHSYGFVAGWDYGDYGQGTGWYWFGDVTVSTVEDNWFGLYTGYSYGLDLMARDYPYYLICRSAGNDRDDDGPPPGTEHYYMEGSEWEGSTDTRDPDGDYDCMLPRAVAKNVLTVGAVDDILGGWSAPGSVSMTVFSAWGPCDDGRIKPDITGNGIGLYSTYDGSDSDYGTLSGTSMSTPSVAGSLGLLIEHWRATHAGEGDMRSATLKGLVIHTADEAGSANGPDYEYGWGLMNTLTAANAISDDGDSGSEPLTISAWDLNDGNWLELLITTDGTSDLRATICWTDPPGPAQSGVLDPPTKILVNDLDLRIERTSPPTTYQPWVLDGANPSTAATTGGNDTDNVEQVVVYSPGTDNFVLRVTHKGTLSDGPQNFSAIITGAAQIQVSTATIAGNVTTSATTAIPDVDVTGTNSGASYVTDAAGYYELPLPLGLSETVTPCRDGWLFEPPSRSYDPVTADLSAEGFVGTLLYDLDPPGTGDEFVGVGDLSYFVVSWLQSVPPADPLHDFDCDDYVGVGDFSYFLTAWLKDVFDASITFPPRRLCSGGIPGPQDDIRLELRLVAITAPSARDQTQELPESVARLGVGQIYFLEMWVRDMDGTGPGVTSAYADVVFGAGRSMAQAVLPSELFETFASGSIDKSAVRDLGGSALAAGVGTGDRWARVATVELDATAPGRVRYDLHESATGVAAYGRGKVPWDNIETFGVTVNHVGLSSVKPYDAE